MKRICLALLLCAMLALCGCQQYDIDILERGSYSRETTQYLSGELEPDYALNDGTTVEPVTLVDTDGVVAKLLGVENTSAVPELQLVFDKGNYEYIDFLVDYMLVDGWQVPGSIVPPFETYMLIFKNFSKDYVRFPGVIIIGAVTLAECGLVDEVHDIEFAYQLVGWSAGHEDLIDEGVYTAETSNGGEPIPYSSDGPVLLEADGLKIQMYAFRRGTTDWSGEDCMELILYLENNSDRRLEVVIGDAEVYKKEDPEEEEETEDDTRTVIVRKEKDGRYTDSVPLNGETNVCAGMRELAGLQTAYEGGTFTLPDDEVLSFSLKIYDYEDYKTYDPDANSDDQPDPLYEKTVTLTTEDMFSPG